MQVFLRERTYPTPGENLHASLISEDRPDYIPHDLLFKKLIETFFEEFIEVFFPEMYAEINFQSVKFLSEEIIPDALDVSERRVDIVVEVKWKETNSLIIIHVEPQSYKQKDFNKRMFAYYCLLYGKYQRPIIPIAIFSNDQSKDLGHYTISFKGKTIIQFNYHTISLKQLNWREFVMYENPVSAVLMSRMGYNESEKVKVKLEFLRILQRLKLTEEKMTFLYRFFDVYVQLSKEEGKKLMTEIKKDTETFDLSSLPIAIAEWSKEEGRKEGKAEGMAVGKAEGMAVGKAEGMVEGKAEGKEEEKRKIAIRMLERNMPLETIVEVTELDKDSIAALRKEV